VRAAARNWSSITTIIEAPSVSDSRMNSWRLSSQAWPTAVRNSMPAIHSPGCRSTSRMKACRCVMSERITCAKRGSAAPSRRCSAAWVSSFSFEGVMGLVSFFF
jgi:hypothetical protein